MKKIRFRLRDLITLPFYTLGFLLILLSKVMGDDWTKDDISNLDFDKPKIK